MTIQQRFEKSNRENPEVYQELVRLARVAKVQGLKTYSVKTMMEVLRWNFMMRRIGINFQMNNDYTSRYARLIEKKERDLRGFFQTRKLKA